ncbi:uncharacterized protein LOC132038024 [Lycium ferocissimum]|uniref:uncharacterized protein LOC132038024 n=1 Tax=Lycium ferocissimum TaxID=112874 RepID=UPI002816646E|nr:uncharacterized protein LOC132038024 [Lycium ferocissimum]
MVKERIVLGHKISEKGIEVDQAKIDMISKLSPPISVKGIRRFLGDSSFYRRFIKNFSKIANPMCKLLEKEAKLEFDEKYRKVKDCKGTENQIADHLYRLEEAGRPSDELDFDEAFQDERMLAVSMELAPWFADIANYLVIGIILEEIKSYQKKVLRDSRQYYWDEPYLFRTCADNIIRHCVPKSEVMAILKACHDSPVGGYHSGNRTAAKVLECDYYQPTLFHHANLLVRSCDQCQRQGSIGRRKEMP